MGKPVHKHIVSLLLYFGEKACCSCHGGNGLSLILCDLHVSACAVDMGEHFNCVEGSLPEQQCRQSFLPADESVLIFIIGGRLQCNAISYMPNRVRL